MSRWQWSVLAGLQEMVTLRVAGGRVGAWACVRRMMRVSGGERVIVFLDTSAVPSTVVGMQQGKFTVQDNMVTG